MLAQLEGFTAAQLNALDEPTRGVVASELGALEETVLASPALRAVLGDTSIDGVTRGAVLGELLVDRVAPTTARIATYAATHAPAPEVVSALGELAHVARSVATEGSQTFNSLGLLAARRRIYGFIDALLADEDVATFHTIEDELFRWARAIESHAELRRFLLDRDAPLEARVATTRGLLEGRVLASTLAIAEFVVVGGRPRDVVGTLDAAVNYVAAARHWRVARVHTARPLDEASREELVSSLTALTGLPVELQIDDDERLLGGVVVEVGTLRLDATTKGRLGALRESVTSGHFYESAVPRHN